MLKRCCTIAAIAGLVLFSNTALVEAGRYSRLRIFRPRHTSVKQTVTQPQTATYPRVRQIDGRSLWDLGKQNGEWPTIRF